MALSVSGSGTAIISFINANFWNKHAAAIFKEGVLEIKMEMEVFEVGRGLPKAFNLNIITIQP
jgi:hypothetical protein